jgi:hypothetical protein
MTAKGWCPSTASALSSKRLILAVVGLAVVALIMDLVLHFRSLAAIQDDRDAQCYLRALYTELAAYKEAHGRWPAKIEMESYQPHSVLCSYDNEPLPADVIHELWDECRILQPQEPQGALAYIPSRTLTHGMRTVEIVNADGMLDRKPATLYSGP